MTGFFELSDCARRSALHPASQPTKFDLVINLQTAKRLGLVPPVCSPPLTRSLSNAGHFRYWHETDIAQCPL
jgi:hypothetical protein